MLGGLSFVYFSLASKEKYIAVGESFNYSKLVNSPSMRIHPQQPPNKVKERSAAKNKQALKLSKLASRVATAKASRIDAQRRKNVTTMKFFAYTAKYRGQMPNIKLSKMDKPATRDGKFD